MKHSGKRLEDLPPVLRSQVERAMGQQAGLLPPSPVKDHGRANGAISPPTPVKRQKSLKTRTRNHATWTEAAYWGHLRSHLRRAFRFWKPALAALKAARVAYKGSHGAKWAFLCADCGKLFRRQGVQIDHVEPCGALTNLDHLPDFLARLTPEDPAAFKIRCKRCHQLKTTAERDGA